MPKLTLSLNEAEYEAVLREAARQAVTPQALTRAIYYALLRNPESPRHREIVERAGRQARHGKAIRSGVVPGQQKGLTREDYAEAWASQKSVNGVAKSLGVTWKTARDQLDVYGLRDPSRIR